MTLLANRRARRPDGGASLAGWTTVQRTVWVSQAALLLLLGPCCHCCPLHPPPLTASLLPSASSTTAGTSSTKAGLAPSSHWPASGRPSCWRVAVHDNDSPRQSMTCCCVYGVGSAAALLIVLLLSSSRPPSRLCSAGAQGSTANRQRLGKRLAGFSGPRRVQQTQREEEGRMRVGMQQRWGNQSLSTLAAINTLHLS